MDKCVIALEVKAQQGLVSKYSLGKIKSKYLILDILAFAWYTDYKRARLWLFDWSRSSRTLLTDNYPLFLSYFRLAKMAAVGFLETSQLRLNFQEMGSSTPIAFSPKNHEELETICKVIRSRRQSDDRSRRDWLVLNIYKRVMAYEINQISENFTDLPCNVYIRCIPTSLNPMLKIISKFGPIACIEVVPSLFEP